MLFLFCCFLDDLKVVPLDYSELSQKTSIPEKLVTECVNDIVVLFAWGAGLGEDYDLVFKGIGSLMSRNKILTMRYHPEFLLAIDGTGAVLECLLSVSLFFSRALSEAQARHLPSLGSHSQQLGDRAQE